MKEAVANYYGNVVAKTEDLVYGACCIDDYDPQLTEHLTDEILSKRYGCGSPIPELLEGATVLDLGCGAGADCFIAAKEVGPEGRVIGIDMTEAQLATARENIEPIMANLGYTTANVEFHLGQIESVPVADASVDVVISNCVINLSTDKAAVFAEIARILKPGGEFYISDIVADRRIPEHLQQDDVLFSECLTGAAYQEDLRRLLASVGFPDCRVVKRRRLEEVIEGIRFDSIVLRGFKLPLEDRCEDFGQVALYKGTIPGQAAELVFDDHHTFPAGTAIRVCGNTAAMLGETRYEPHFHVTPRIAHLGPFDCDTPGIESTATPNDALRDRACC